MNQITFCKFKILRLLSVAILVAIGFIACNNNSTNSNKEATEEVTRLSIEKVSTSFDSIYEKETTVELKEGDHIHFWSEMELEYEGDINLVFQVKPFRDTTSIGILKLDALEGDQTLGETKTDVEGKTNWTVSKHMKEIIIEHDAKYTFKTILISSPNKTLVLKRADLVIKR
jgi:hypothetical protein